MSEKVSAGWLTGYDGNKFAPKTFINELLNSNGASVFANLNAGGDLGSSTTPIYIDGGQFRSCSLPTATNEVFGMVKVGAVGDEPFDPIATDLMKGVNISEDGILYIDLDAASADEYGVVKVYEHITDALDLTPSSVADYYYGVCSDRNGKLYVNVPWTDHYVCQEKHKTTGADTGYPLLSRWDNYASGTHKKVGYCSEFTLNPIKLLISGPNFSMQTLTFNDTTNATSLEMKLVNSQLYLSKNKGITLQYEYSASSLEQCNINLTDGRLTVSKGIYPSTTNSLNLGNSNLIWNSIAVGSIWSYYSNALRFKEESGSTRWYGPASGTTSRETATLDHGYYSKLTLRSYGTSSGTSEDTSKRITLNALDGSISAVQYTATSDRRLKENLQNFSHGDILDLPIYKFDYINGTKNHIGCMAQDLQAICPEIVHENESGYLTIEENKIIYLLLNKMKEMKKEINELKGV